MNSIKCGNCSLVNFAASGVCKRCESPLGSAEGNEFQTQQFAPSEPYTGQADYASPSELTGQHQQYYGPARSDSRKGKPIAVVLLALICLVGVVGVPLYLKSSKGEVASLSKTEFAGLSWRELKPDDGSFSILMPGEPKHNSASGPTPVGNVQMNMFYFETEGKTSFAVISFNYPVVSPNVPVDALFDKAIQSLSSRSEIIILSRKNITLDGYPGIEVEIKPPAKLKKDGDKGVLHIYWVSPKIYMVAVGGPDSPEASAARTKFLDSFKVIKSR